MDGDMEDDAPLELPSVPVSRVVPSEVLNPKLLGSVVKLFVTKAEPNYCMPWQVKPQRQSTSSAFVVSGRRLITNAHCVFCETSVRARRRGSPKKFTAKVITINQQSDLAMLTVEDNSFWDNLEELDFDQVPELQENVVVAGYPAGGDSISVTKGVVSRVDLRDYGHGSFLLTIQIDAAINAGNSGGPAFNKNDKVVGVARAHLKNAQNIGYIIPLPVIKHFIATFDKYQEQHQGLCGIGFRVQYAENDHLRAKLRMRAEHTGVLVTTVSKTGPEHGVLEVGDVVMEADGVKIADDGTIPFRGSSWSEERISFLHQFNHKDRGDAVNLEILRQGQVTPIQYEAGMIPALVPSMHGYDCRPSYFVCGGLVFVPLTTRFLTDYYGSEWRRRCPAELLHVLWRGFRERVDEQCVVLCHLLVADVNFGYKFHTAAVLKAFNDQPILSLPSLVKLVTECSAEYMEFKLEDGSQIVLSTDAARKSEAEILKQHNIPSAMSPDISHGLSAAQHSAANGDASQ
mmetsp:Transcript_20374/g.41134  ORF Transcript_20374/g.41134 Transcript_20374/m.41134 type:complete len:515 (-) Transcript_20374:137-1681(-)|eukprot:CAMPEP_0196749722 /NCGR_PEP_ID=MMETSP1091-20130531/78028_1 /TAXON_ID=302021 /ORGANISM="Rhodomonas sp., Strain CCMP768" /LENGTH=514 /DNA_ID=CAMNT_0042097247 /DNA_START=177 /DNA_END=1721 /DNA_ORIENTATION=+